MDCFYCDFWAEDAKQIAMHINQNHPNKKRGWANKVLTDVERLDKKVSQKMEGRLPYTEEQKQAREACIRPVSGIERIALCTCPACRQTFQMRVAKEYFESDTAWRIGDKLAIVCDFCRVTKKKW
jgi:hypothetical protein